MKPIPRFVPHIRIQGREIIIRLLAEELRYSVDYETWKAAQSRDDDNTKFEMQTDEENSYWITRCFSEAVSDILRRLSAYRIGNFRMRTDQIDEGCREWIIHLLMEEGWMGDPSDLVALMHRYVVCKTLAEWYAMTVPDLSAVHLQKAEALMRDIVMTARDVDVSGVKFIL